MGEFATQKLVDKTCNFCFIVEELTEIAFFKNECPNGFLGNHRRCGQPISPESDFANEVTFFQMRDLTASDRDPDAARANEEELCERLILFGQRGALRNIARLAGDEQMRDLRIVEAGEDTAKQCAIGLWQTQRQAAPSNGFLGEPLLVSIA